MMNPIDNPLSKQLGAFGEISGTGSDALENLLVANPGLKSELDEVLAIAAKEPLGGSVKGTLRLMQHPIFDVISRLLEWKVPKKVGFGKFRARD